MIEDILINVCDHGPGHIKAEMSLSRMLGTVKLKIRYGGGRFDPRKPADIEIDEFTTSFLSKTGIIPVWRWRLGTNELSIPVSSSIDRSEILMIGCIAAAIVIGLLGQYIPEPIRNTVTDYGLSFLSDGFLNLLNTFIGIMIFLTVITGICGIGSAAALGRVGRQMMIRFISSTFLISIVMTAGVQFFFPLAMDEGGSASGFRAILEMIFGILPDNPVKPFQDGNTLQIVFMGAMIGILLLVTGSQTENLRKVILEAQILTMRCVEAICVLLPLYVFSSLIIQLWTTGPQMLSRFWKPLVVSLFICSLSMAVYLVYTCLKLRVRPSVLVPKLIPDFVIGLCTASSSAAFATGMDINENKLGIDKAFARMAFPIGGIFFAGNYSLLFAATGAFIAECYDVHTDIAWWVTLWIVCSLLAMATPPVAGGNISCLSVMMAQLHIPASGLALGVALAMLLDFICTGSRIPIFHMELAMQAHNMELLDHEVLRNK